MSSTEAIGPTVTESSEVNCIEDSTAGGTSMGVADEMVVAGRKRQQRAILVDGDCVALSSVQKAG